MIILIPLCVGEYEMKLKHKKLLLINIMGSFVLICWLIFGALDIPIRGQIILWNIGILVFLIGIAELATNSNIS